MILLAISNGWKTVIMILAMILVFYFFLIHPQNEEAKKEAAYRNSLKPGDRIMTANGIHATIVSTDVNQALLEIAPNRRIRVSKATIQPIPEPKKK